MKLKTGTILAATEVIEMGQGMQKKSKKTVCYTKTAFSLLFGVTSIMLAAPSLAQSGPDSAFNRDRNVNVLERERPEYDSVGLRRGSFVVRPKLDSYVVYSDNVFASPDQEEEDGILTVRPSLDLESDWLSHNLRGYANVLHQQYFENTDETTTGYSVGANGRYDINRAISVEAGGDFNKGYERRSSAGAGSVSAEPIEFDRSDIFIGVSREVGRTRFLVRGALQDLNYRDAALEDNTLIDQDFRDQKKTSIDARADLALSPDRSIFAQAVFSNIDHDTLPLSGITRDRDTFAGRVGADFELSSLVRGQVGVGFFSTEFDSSAFPDVNGFSFDGKVEWFATPLITVTATGQRGSRASELLISPASTQSQFGLKADYEYRRNIILSSGYDYIDDDYNFIDRSDERNAAYLGGLVLLNPRVGLETRISYRSLKSKGALRQFDFNETRLLVGLRLQL